jgi:DNA primase
MPIEWEELSDAHCKPDRWTVANAVDHVQSDWDAWSGMSRRARTLPGFSSLG